MTYAEMLVTRAQRAVERAAYLSNCCAGCRVHFSEYGMTKAQAYVEHGHAYCNSDCALSAEVDRIEAADFAALSD